MFWAGQLQFLKAVIFCEFPFYLYPGKLRLRLRTIRNSTQRERENNLIETLPKLISRDTPDG